MSGPPVQNGHRSLKMGAIIRTIAERLKSGRQFSRALASSSVPNDTRLPIKSCTYDLDCTNCASLYRLTEMAATSVPSTTLSLAT